MLEKDRLIVKIMHLAYLVNETTEYCVFIRFAGHVDRLEVQVVESKKNFSNELFRAERETYYREYADKDGAIAHIASLKSFVRLLETIIEDKEIPYEEMDYAEELIRHYHA